MIPILIVVQSLSHVSLWHHGLQPARLPCPSPSPRACWNSCPLSRWYHPTILSSVVPLSACLWSFPASGSFLMSQLFASGGQRCNHLMPKKEWRYIYVCVCVCVYTYIYVSVYIYVYVCVCVGVCVYIYITDSLCCTTESNIVNQLLLFSH